MKKCKYCKKINKRKRSDFCSDLCYHKWRYHNIPECREKILSLVKKNNKLKYKKDKKFRKKQIKYSLDWAKKNTKRVREISRDYQRRKNVPTY